MYTIGSDWRKRHTMFDPSRFSIENYCTDTKKEMKHSFGDELLNNLHLLPDPLKKNLADSLITDEKPKQRSKTMLNMESVETKPAMPNPELASPNLGASPLPTLSGITSFFSGVMNVISSAMFLRRSPSPPQYYDCCDEPNVIRQGSPVGWHGANIEDQNKNVRAHNLISNSESDLVSDMSKDCLEAAAQCEDKLNRLRLLLKSKPVETPNCVRRPRKRSVSPPQEKTVSEPGSVEKQSPNIQDSLTFANEIRGDDLSSVENSPAIQSLDRLSNGSVNSKIEDKDYFDEISGRFHSTSATESEDSFQIVFTDSPQTPPTRPRVPSDCESEDSFIVFEESPDSCYTSHDVFGEELASDDDYSDSDVDVCDSGCVSVTKLAHPLSRTFVDLTDDSLYEDKPVDVVDCAVRTVCEEIPSEDIKDVSDVCETDNEVKSTGLLLNDAKKVLRKSLPPKKVHFSPDPPKVHVMRVWAFAARQARAGHWERCAIDRERFKRRIADVDMAVSWVLKPQHRSRVMFQRFMPWWNAQRRKEIAEKKQKEAEDKIRTEKELEDRLKADAEAEEERLQNEKLLEEEDIHKVEELADVNKGTIVNGDVKHTNSTNNINVVAKNINADAKDTKKNEIKEQKPLTNGTVSIAPTKKKKIKNLKKCVDKIVAENLKIVAMNGNSNTKLERTETVSGT